jgi:F-type H+-transporting ATPase subunit c
MGLPVAVVGAALGQGIAIYGALQGMARQPENSGTIQTAMIIGLALIESLAIYALLTFFILQGKLPAISSEQALQMAQQGASAVGR